MGPPEDNKRSLAKKVKDFLAEARKTVLVAIPVLGMIVGTDAPLYLDIVGVLTVLGVYEVPNRDRKDR